MQALQKVDQDQGLITAYKREEIDLIKQTVARGATDIELNFFLYTAQLRGLNPLAKQIYFQKRKNSRTGKEDMTILTGIDGYRLIADRTGKYAGCDDLIFDDEENPRKATAIIYKIVGGTRCAFTASARWDQYYPGDHLGFMWRKMPHLMLGKCAEALALRKAFPEELSGLYVKEEMDQAGPPISYEESNVPPPEYGEGNQYGAETGSSPSSGVMPPIDRYIGTEEQKNRLKSTLKALKINDGPAMLEMHKAFLKAELEMEHFDAGVREWLSDHNIKV